MCFLKNCQRMGWYRPLRKGWGATVRRRKRLGATPAKQARLLGRSPRRRRFLAELDTMVTCRVASLELRKSSSSSSGSSKQRASEALSGPRDPGARLDVRKVRWTQGAISQHLHVGHGETGNALNHDEKNALQRGSGFRCGGLRH